LHSKHKALSSNPSTTKKKKKRKKRLANKVEGEILGKRNSRRVRGTKKGSGEEIRPMYIVYIYENVILKPIILCKKYTLIKFFKRCGA
jgi:hypothetical protein